MIVILMIVFVIMWWSVLYAHRKHQDSLSTLCDAFNRIAEKIEK